MNFIDRTYFIGDINIPNTGSELVGSLLDIYIEKYEPEFFYRLMGVTMYTNLKAAGLPANPSPTATADNQKYIDLIEGKNYTYYDRDYNYFGIAPGYNGTEILKESPIANYIYYWFMRGTATQTTTGGEKKTSNENSVDASPGDKMARAWNEISKWERDYRRFVSAYPLVYTTPYCYGQVFAPINEFNI